MQYDKLNEFCAAEATGNTGERVLGDVIDLTVGSDLGAGNTISLVARVETAIAAGAGGTYQLKLVSASDASLSSDVVTHMVTAELDAATGVAAGTDLLKGKLPNGDYGRYLGLKEVVGTANTSAGKIDAFLVPGPTAYKSYADADK